MKRQSTNGMRNPNRNIWNNNGTYWIHYTTYPTPVTKERVRHSLRTKSLTEARARRDEILSRSPLRVARKTPRRLALAA